MGGAGLGMGLGGGARERGRSRLLWGVRGGGRGVSDPGSLWRKSCRHLQAECLKCEI